MFGRGAGAGGLLANDSDGRTWDSLAREGRFSSEGGLLSEYQEGACAAESGIEGERGGAGAGASRP